ncbi:copper homeostasis protein CutC [Suttonella sp. R2A3]|uniref:copper homeostasis protein CutC n=1 Tax=Suttonella sp. R2A3 TaxID=2908648 RepID=UPI001F403B95|nr:copper homeostasis protein CutC [Suttonella sp. R2A3]UJF25038.1 copper homeostasis protein CutC [Suttonella sp. R2A3]
MMALLEVCVETIADAKLAVAHGADRIELCAQLSEDGLTPTADMLTEISSIDAPCMVMIRPRAGDFVYDAAALKQMHAEITAAKLAGAAGLVFGALNVDNELDIAALKELLAAAEGLPVTLHRAFDALEDPFAALETAIELGFSRILSAGGAASAWVGREQLAAMVKQAGDRLTILPGVGVRAEHASALLRETGASELHASCRQSGLPADQVRVDFQAVQALRAAIDR